MKRRKVSVIGAGNVGAATALRLAGMDIFDIALIDAMEGLAKGRALDIQQVGAMTLSDSRIEGGSDYTLTANSDIVIITAGLPRLPGMTRADLLSQNAETVGSCVRSVLEHSSEPFLIVVTNPLDAMCHVALDASGLGKQRVIGMAGMLDTMRFRTFIAHKLGVLIENVDATVIGGHGPSMVPLVRFATAAGAPLAELMEPDEIEAVLDRTRNAGSEIVGNLGTGGASFAPAAAIVDMVHAIHGDEHKIIPCSVLLEGEYDIDGVFVGVPCILSSVGVERVVELDLSVDELILLRRSADHVGELRDQLKKFGN